MGKKALFWLLLATSFARCESWIGIFQCPRIQTIGFMLDAPSVRKWGGGAHSLSLFVVGKMQILAHAHANALQNAHITNLHTAWKLSRLKMYRFVVRPSPIAGLGVFATGRGWSLLSLHLSSFLSCLVPTFLPAVIDMRLLVTLVKHLSSRRSAPLQCLLTISTSSFPLNT